jgi:hypothetical protein
MITFKISFYLNFSFKKPIHTGKDEKYGVEMLPAD